MYPFGGEPEPDRQETDPEQVEPEQVDNDDIDPFLNDSVLRWRAKRLRDNGMIPSQARVLALDRTVEVHWVVERLLKRGCHPDTAFLIAS